MASTFEYALLTLIFLGLIAFIIWGSSRNKRKESPYNRPRTDIKPYTPPKEKPLKPAPAPVKTQSMKRKPGPSADTIKAMHAQADAERCIAEALERKAAHITDPVKRARIARQAANSWLRFNKILDQIDKITQQ